MMHEYQEPGWELWAVVIGLIVFMLFIALVV